MCKRRKTFSALNNNNSNKSKIFAKNLVKKLAFMLAPVEYIIVISKFLAQDNDFLSFLIGSLSPCMIWAIIVKFDQIRKNWWRISCAEVLEVGKNFFAASSVKKIYDLRRFHPKKSRELLENLLKQLFFSDLPDMSW